MAINYGAGLSQLTDPTQTPSTLGAQTLGSYQSSLGGEGTHLANDVGLANSNGKSAAGAFTQSVGAQNAATQGIVNQMGTSGGNYQNTTQGNTNTYDANAGTISSENIGALNQYKTDLGTQATNSANTYNNNVLPQLKTLQTQTGANAAGAMSLADAENPNNSVATAVQNQYNTQAQGIQNQGLANYGVLAALGSQATANTIGGAGQPILGSQMENLQNANMGQASQAFGNAQSNANNLKLQGIQAGQNQSNWAYGQGQNAIQTAAGITGDIQNASTQQSNTQNMYSGEENQANQGIYQSNQNWNNSTYGANQQQAGLNYGVQQGQFQNQLGANNQIYGSQQGIDTSNIAASNASQSGKLNAIGGLAGGAFGYGTGTGQGVLSAIGGGASQASGSSGGGAAGAAGGLGLTGDSSGSAPSGQAGSGSSTLGLTGQPGAQGSGASSQSGGGQMGMVDDGSGNYSGYGGANGGYGLGVGGSSAPAYSQGGYGYNGGQPQYANQQPLQSYGGGNGGGQSIMSQTAQGAQLGGQLMNGFFGNQAPNYANNGYNGYTGGLSSR